MTIKAQPQWLGYVTVFRVASVQDLLDFVPICPAKPTQLGSRDWKLCSMHRAGRAHTKRRSESGLHLEDGLQVGGRKSHVAVNQAPHSTGIANSKSSSHSAGTEFFSVYFQAHTF